MVLSDLQDQLKDRIASSCGGASVDPATLSPFLENARTEFAAFHPTLHRRTYTISSNTDTVALLDDDGADLDVTHVEGAWLTERGGAPDYPNSRSPWANRDEEGLSFPPLPNESYAAAAYHDRYQRFDRPITFDRVGNTLYLVKPRGLNVFTLVVVFGTAPDWGDIGAQWSTLILDRALAYYLDSVIIGKSGLLRIPTPNGSFEFDGGRILLSLRDRLVDNFEARVQQRTSVILNG